jgi:hypothetical protein
MNGLVRAALLLFVALSLAAPAALAKPSKPAKSNTFMYTGQLIDENRNPIGGVYPLQFALYASGQSEKPLWKETHWVAVDQGLYQVELGTSTAIPKKLKLQDLSIGVGLEGGAQLTREDLRPYVAGPDQAADLTPPPINPLATAPTMTSPRPKGMVDYADRAGYAIEAEHAGTADRLDNMTVEELKKVVASKVSIGKARKYTDSVGGDGGYEFTEMCPDGYVVVGISGAAGRYIDNFRLVCAPLE